jgi:hypothetical protein
MLSTFSRHRRTSLVDRSRRATEGRAEKVERANIARRKGIRLADMIDSHVRTDKKLPASTVE